MVKIAKVVICRIEQTNQIYSIELIDINGHVATRFSGYQGMKEYCAWASELSDEDIEDIVFEEYTIDIS